MDIKKKIQKDLTIIAVYIYQTHGLPVEVFNKMISNLSLLDQAATCIRFRKKHKKLFNEQLYDEKRKG